MTLNIQNVNDTYIIGSNISFSHDGLNEGMFDSKTFLHIPSHDSEGHQLKQIGSGAFFNYTYLQHVYIEPSIEILNPYCFHYCLNLLTINIPSTVIHIGNNAFDDCFKLVQVSFDSPSSLKSIGHFAFNTCTNLKYIYLPPSVESLSRAIFSEINNITLYFNSNKEIKNCPEQVNLFNKTLNYTVYVPLNGPDNFCGYSTTKTSIFPISTNFSCNYKPLSNYALYRTLSMIMLISSI